MKLFEYCMLKEKICPLAGHSKGIYFCGLATSNNIIKEMKKCPKKK